VTERFEALLVPLQNRAGENRADDQREHGRTDQPVGLTTPPNGTSVTTARTERFAMFGPG